MKKLNIKQGTTEWLQYRKKGIGASDIPALTGSSPFKRSIDIYLDKKDLAPSQFITTAMMRGSVYEQEARNHHNKIENKNFVPIVAEHDDYPYFFASLDGYDKDSNSILEIKVPSSKVLLEKTIEGEMFKYYEEQVQWQLFVTGAQCAVFAVYWPETHEMYEIIIEPNKEIIEHLKGVAIDFWLNFTQNISPEEINKYEKLSFPNHEKYFNDYKKYMALKKEAEEGLNRLRPFLLGFEEEKNWEAHGLKFTQIKGRISYDYNLMIKDGLDLDKYKKLGKAGWKISIENNKEDIKNES